MRAGLVLFAFVASAGCDHVFFVTHVDPVVADATPDAPVSVYAEAVKADGPLAFYRLGETMPPLAHDEQGGAPCEYIGAVDFAQPGALAADRDTAVHLGTEGRAAAGIVCGDRFDFAGVASFSLEAWVRSVWDGHPHVIVSKWTDAQVGWLLYGQDRRIVFARATGGQAAQQDLVNADRLSQTEWVHVVATYDGAMMRVYADGQQVNLRASTRSLPDSELSTVIGAQNGSTTSGVYFGDLDEVAIYPTALGVEQIDAHYRAGRP